MKNNINTIIFDLGAVLIDWHPKYVFTKVFETEEKMNWFFENICTSDWNEKQDAGRSLKEATEELVAIYPEYEQEVRAYYGRWDEMLGGPIDGTVAILRQLKDAGLYKLYALTNWSAELFPIALQRYEFLHWFDGRLVSGEEKMRKPYPEFFQLLLDRFNINKDESLFIDDNLRNAEAAESFGLKTIRFKTPVQLKEDLEKLQLL